MKRPIYLQTKFYRHSFLQNSRKYIEIVQNRRPNQRMNAKLLSRSLHNSLKSILSSSSLRRESVRATSQRFISTATASQLRVFPEFASASEFENAGSFHKAIPLYQRMHDVLCGAMGKSSAVSAELVCHNARLFMLSGDFGKAIKLVQSEITSDAPKAITVHYFNLLAEAYLLSGDTEKAFEAAQQAVDACEAHSESESDEELALFSPAYGMLGLTL